MLFDWFVKPPPGPPLSQETQRRLEILFAAPDRTVAAKLLFEQCGNNLPGLGKLNPVELERCRFAALKISNGSLDQLRAAVALAQTDWRDLLMEAGFGDDVEAHRRWEPQI